MFEVQLEHWTKVPLATNTQPDFSNVGNSDMLDRTIRSGNWIRTDTIFIENTQIEALSYRPPWAAAICEVGFTTGDPKELRSMKTESLTTSKSFRTRPTSASIICRFGAGTSNQRPAS